MEAATKKERKQIMMTTSNDSYSCGSYDCQGCKCKQQHGDGQVKLTIVHEQKEKKKMAEMPSINF